MNKKTYLENNFKIMSENIFLVGKRRQLLSAGNIKNAGPGVGGSLSPTQAPLGDSLKPAAHSQR